jgi:hypothetical protein
MPGQPNAKRNHDFVQTTEATKTLQCRMTGMVNRSLEKMLCKNRKEIPSIDVERNFSWKTKETNNAYGYFRGCDQSQLDIHR